jgi:serine/threonine protein kinase
MSRFLPKYYIVSDPLSPFAKDLLMECIRHPTLCEYLLERRESLALQSKLYLAVMIAQALRYLQDYRIAHLDLKPENVMLFRELTIKLIDFGDAYHPDVKRGRLIFTQLTARGLLLPILPLKTTSPRRAILTKTTSFLWESSFMSFSSAGRLSRSTMTGLETRPI